MCLFIACLCLFMVNFIVFCFDSGRIYTRASRTSPSKSLRMTAMTWHTLSSTQTERAGCSNWVSGTTWVKYVFIFTFTCTYTWIRDVLMEHMDWVWDLRFTLTSCKPISMIFTTYLHIILYSSTSFPLLSWWINISSHIIWR